MRTWTCEDCGWHWPLLGDPDDGSECDNCGGDLTLPYTDCECQEEIDHAIYVCGCDCHLSGGES